MRIRGFTLIELLAVIVILAIIALIATPIILNIINNTKDESNERSVELYAEAVKEAVVRYQMNNNESASGKFTSNEDGTKLTLVGETNPKLTLTIDYDGDVVCQTVKIDKSGSIILIKCDVNGEDTNYLYGIPTPKSFTEDSWETIIANVQAGNISVYETNLKENKNNTKTIKLTSKDDNTGNEDGITTGEYAVRIANTTTPVECNNSDFSQSACGFVVEFVDIITTYQINDEANTIGGWKNSKIRRFLTPIEKDQNSGIVYNLLPPEIKNNIIPTTVISSHEKAVSDNYKTIDKIYLLSVREVRGNVTSSGSAANETRKLDYYITNSDTSYAIKEYNKKATNWWLRTVNDEYTDYAYCITSKGERAGCSVPNDKFGVAPAFRIG